MFPVCALRASPADVDCTQSETAGTSEQGKYGSRDGARDLALSGRTDRREVFFLCGISLVA